MSEENILRRGMGMVVGSSMALAANTAAKAMRYINRTEGLTCRRGGHSDDCPAEFLIVEVDFNMYPVFDGGEMERVTQRYHYMVDGPRAQEQEPYLTVCPFCGADIDVAVVAPVEDGSK